MIEKEEDNNEFFKYSRMSFEEFKDLLKTVGPHLEKTSKRKALSPALRLIITLHYLAEGCSMQEMAWNYRIGKTTVHCILKETTAVLWKVLQPLVMPPPTVDALKKVADDFLLKWQVPNCIGSIDGKHIHIQTPKKSGSEFYNYKNIFSIVLMASVDADYNFIAVDIGTSGRNHDSTVFRNSALGSALLNGILPIPAPKPLQGSNIVLPHFVLGDAAFPLAENIMRPYPGQYLGVEKNVFNYRLSRGRRTVENAFGILCQRWRSLRKPILASTEMVEQFVQSTVVLHNYLRRHRNGGSYCSQAYGDQIGENGRIIAGQWRTEEFSFRRVGRMGSNNPARMFIRNRDLLCNYFNNEGAVP
ncbi:uncharacterized protein [Onthophagus taurus]|uniref:uncharacterized protein n=1 Tax=Onthophagus taurus TaxID=166361 RepID=UPI000C20A8D4|nr:protein ALP1-like [Onthophagus taurus]